MSEIDVRIEGVWKQYRRSARRHAAPFWALRGVDLVVPRGSTTGIIGRNGAGKSTLFKLLAGITTPTRGRLTLTGRVAALIEVGSGFHPELTGRENVFLSGAILGLRRRDIQQRLSSIVDFSGIAPFIDTPVKWYSSGMYVRLGFAVAAHLDPDILLVDEVLAVGDAEFQTRCLQRVQELRRRGVTILLISHDLTAVSQLCDHVVLLDEGQAVAAGAAAEVVDEYHRRLKHDEVITGGYAPAAREGAVRITGVLVSDAVEEGPPVTRAMGPLTIVVRFSASRPMRVRFELSYYSADGRTLIARTATGTERPLTVSPPGGAIEFSCSELPLAPGNYHVNAVVREADAGHVIDWWDGGTTLHVAGDAAGEGVVTIPHQWRLVPGHEPLRARAATMR
jgi:lipopolysaccharide transport system ATP-binding protein